MKIPTFVGVLLIALGVGLLYAGIRGWQNTPELDTTTPEASPTP